MNNLNQRDFEDVLNLVGHCVSDLKNAENPRTILSEIIKSFKADEAVFLSATDKQNGVELANSFSLGKDKSFLARYADSYWRNDPLYKRQFSSQHDKLAFKTDDVIPYEQLVELDYYNSFLRPQNLMGELVIRLFSGDNIFGAISLQRYQEHSCFEQKDVLKASLLVPSLVNVFETAFKLVKNNNERILLENWMDSHAQGVILLDTKLQPIFINSKAKGYFLQINLTPGKKVDSENLEKSLPEIIAQDCKNLSNSVTSSHESEYRGNRIIKTKNNIRYYAQYFPNNLPSSENNIPHFIIFLNELNEGNDCGES